MFRTTINYDSTYCLHSMTLDLTLIDHLIRMSLYNNDFLNNSEIWKDTCLFGDDEWCQRTAGYRYEIMFNGSKPVYLISVYCEDTGKFIYKHRNSILNRIKLEQITNS